MRTAECYSSEELRKFALGMVSAEFSERVVDHLTECEVCEETVAALDSDDDTVIRSLRKPAGDEAALKDAAYHRAIDRVKSHLPTDSTSHLGRYDRQTVLGDYQLIGQLGAGGMGTVYRAVHTRLERTVAIKVLPARRLQDPAAVARFKREMMIVGQLNHPAIVQATDAGEMDGTHFLVMEFVSGYDLAKVARSCGPLAVADACELARQVAMGLQHAHAQDIVHRDVKPSNVMLTRDGKVKILDLGLALVGGIHGHGDELTTVGQLMGSLDYMAPEQCDNSHEVDARADIYGLAATLYKLLCGVAPYVEDGRTTPLQKLKALATDTMPRPVSDRQAEVPGELSDLVQRGLSRDAADRYESIEAFANALSPWARDACLHELVVLCDQGRADESAEDLPIGGANLPSSRSPTNGAAGDGMSDSAKIGSAKRWLRTAAVTSLFTALVAFAGYVIYLETDTGNLVIDCASADVNVKIMRNKKLYKSLRLEQGQQSTHVRSGEYEIVIDGPSTGLSVQDGEFTIHRNGAWLAKIQQLPKEGGATSAERVDATPQLGFRQPLADLMSELTALEKRREFFANRLGPNHPQMVELNSRIQSVRQRVRSLPQEETADRALPVYDGKSFGEWERILQTDRSSRVMADGINAMLELGEGELRERALRAVVQTARNLNRGESLTTGPGSHPATLETAFFELIKDEPELGDQVLLEELECGNSTSREFAIRHLRAIPPIVAAAADEDPAVRDVAVQRLAFLPIKHRKDPAVVARLREAIQGDNIFIATVVASALLDVDSDMATVTPLLEQLLKKAPPHFKGGVAWAISKVGARAASAVPLLLDILRSDEAILSQQTTSTGPGNVMGKGTYVISAKEAAVIALGAIGPAAKDALPLLEKELERTPGLRQGLPPEFSIEHAIQLIEQWDPNASLAEYTLGPGDVLGIYILGIIGREGPPKPIESSRQQNLPPAFGLPVPVLGDGSIMLPYVGQVQVNSLTIGQVKSSLVRAYTVDNNFLDSAQAQIMVSLVERRTRRRRRFLENYTIANGDVLSVFVPGVLGPRDEEIGPIHFPDDARIPPAVGYPVHVTGGAIDLPLVAPIPVSGLTLRQAANVVKRTYTVDNKILRSTEFVLLGLMKVSEEEHLPPQP